MSRRTRWKSGFETLDAFRRSFDEAQQVVVQKLRELGLEPSVRIKTTISIVEKLKRESIRLSKLQDIAGCRVVVEDVEEQDRVVALIVEVFPTAAVIDRRQQPSHGYRAVHVIIDIEGRFVEVQHWGLATKGTKSTRGLCLLCFCG